MAKWPNKIKAGSIYDYPIHQNDILPTVAEAAGAQIPNDRIIDGKNLIPYINNEIKIPPHETLFWISGRLKTVMHNEWKLIKDEKINKNWLFNLSNDPTERNNLAEANPIKVTELEFASDRLEKLFTTISLSEQMPSINFEIKPDLKLSGIFILSHQAL